VSTKQVDVSGVETGVGNLLQLSRELTETIFWRSVSSREDRSSTWRLNSPVNRHRRSPGWKQTRWVVVLFYQLSHIAQPHRHTHTYNKLPRRTALTSTGTQAKYNNSEGLARA